jgi:hypothetical protein
MMGEVAFVPQHNAGAYAQGMGEDNGGPSGVR